MTLQARASDVRLCMSLVWSGGTAVFVGDSAEFVTGSFDAAWLEGCEPFSGSLLDMLTSLSVESLCVSELMQRKVVDIPIL